MGPATRSENNVTLIGEQFNEKRFCRKNCAVVANVRSAILITMPAERRVADGVQVASLLERDYPGGLGGTERTRLAIANWMSVRSPGELLQEC